jgi:chromate reductase
MSPIKVAVVVGSNRRESINRRLAQALVKLAGDGLDFRFVPIDDLPLYNQDEEANLPPAVVRFKSQIVAADAALFVTPEHSRSIPAVLKNAIDWGARPWGQNSWTGKVAAVTGTSPGAISTALAQQHLRQILGAQGVVLSGGEAYLQFKPDLIAADGTISDEGARGFLKSFLEQFAALAVRFAVAARAAA